MQTADRRPHQGGRLFLVGGSEDRTGDKRVLQRFVELCGGDGSSIIVLTAATSIPQTAWDMYDQAFGELGIRSRGALFVDSRNDANDPACAQRILAADGIFMTGGDQRRLVALLGGTRIESAMHTALKEHGACIGGTSAGASAMSEHMLAEGSWDILANRHSAHLGAGLGFLRQVVIDQHFSQRQRLARLLSVVAQNPHLIGVGIDEDTALIIEPDRRLEVVGAGAVTILDGRQMTSNILNADHLEHLELINVRLHVLPGGVSYGIRVANSEPMDDEAPQALREVLALMTRM